MRFTITSDEGLPIHGNLDAPSNPRALAVIVHGFKGYKDWFCREISRGRTFI